jgi:Aspartyl protease
MKWVLAVVAVLSIAAHAKPPGPLSDVPILGGAIQPVIAVTINGTPNVRCVVDTGSSIGVIGRALSRTSSSTGTSSVRVANGRALMHKVEVNEIRIGTTSIRRVEFAQRDANGLDTDAPAPCVLGNNLWNRFTLDIDGHAGRVRLFAKGTRIDDILGGSPPPGAHLDATIYNDAVISAETVVSGVHASATIDTGWSYASANHALLDALNLRSGDPRIHTQLITPLNSTREKALQLADVSSFRLGAVHADTLELDVGSADESIVKGATGAHLHVGWEPLRMHRLLMDLSHQDVAIVP